MTVDTTIRPRPDVGTTTSGTAAEIAHLIAPQLWSYAPELDRTPAALGRSYSILRDVGYLAATVPIELGGAGASLDEVTRAQRTLAAACPNTALAVNMHLFQVGAMAERWRVDRGGEELLRAIADRGIVLASTTGEAIGLDPFTTPTVARRAGGGYRISGRKFFCSQAHVMDLVRVLATDAATGELLLVVVPKDAPGLTIAEPPITMGMRGTQSFDLILDGVEVVDDDVALRLEGSVPLLEPSITAGAVWFMSMIAGVYAGVADGAVDEAMRSRRSDRSIGRLELLRHRLDALLAHGLQRTVLAPELLGALAAATATKDDVVRTAVELVDECVAVTGAAAFSTASRLEQAVRDVRAGRHHPPDPATTLRLLAMPRDAPTDTGRRRASNEIA